MLLTVLFPGLSLLLHKRPRLGVLLLLLQVTLVGWLIGVPLAARNLLLERRRQRRNGQWVRSSTKAQRFFY
ncbi:MAG: YqaE/Pmp3 family membrane protein [Hymenobacter sp.]|nr:MAG: YqaE/Pmp3 family membrane protein [Hymenobacter sp.]